MLIASFSLSLSSFAVFAFRIQSAWRRFDRAAPPAAPSSLRLHQTSASKPGIEEKFLAVPNAKLAGEHLKTLTAEPHLAATPEDHKTAEYVAQKFRAAGLDTEIVPYRVLMNQPKVVHVEAFDTVRQAT